MAERDSNAGSLATEFILLRVVLKVCSRDPYESPRPFPAVHEVRIIFII